MRVSTQLVRGARKLSAAVVPQLTRLEPLTPLGTRRAVLIRLASTSHIQRALHQWIVANAGVFDPIEFSIVDALAPQTILLRAQLFADELVVLLGARRVLSVCLVEADATASVADEAAILAKIRHPVTSGFWRHERARARASTATRAAFFADIRVFELVYVAPPSRRSLAAIDCTSTCAKFELVVRASCWRHALALCGCLFSPAIWTATREDAIVGEVRQCDRFWQAKRRSRSEFLF